MRKDIKAIAGNIDHLINMPLVALPRHAVKA